MKRFILIFFLMGLLSANNLLANISDIFSYDSNKINSELANLDELTQFVEVNEITYSELSTFNHQLISQLKYHETGAFGIQILDHVLGIKSFYWGCCLGAIGVGIVYLATGDLEETKKSFYGCLISTILWGGGLLLQ